MDPEDEFRFFAALALADGRISSEEVNALRRLADGAGLGHARAAELLQEQAADGATLPPLPEDPRVRQRMLERLQQLAAVDGVAPEELRLLRGLWEAARRATVEGDEARVGPYLLHETLGRGAAGTVYRATHQFLGVEVALKLLSPRAGTPQARERFLREARTTARLRHPGIVPTLDAGSWNGTLFLTMELVPGGASWEARLERDGPISPPVAARAVAQAARAMAYAHAHGVVHRDLKPGNLVPDANVGTRVIDFGVAYSLTEGRRITLEGGFVGTPAFMAPEQAHGQQVSPAGDVYGLGASLYALLTGRPPFPGPSLLELLGQLVSSPPEPPSRLSPVPSELEAITLRCLEKDPAARYPGAEALAEALEGFLGGVPSAPRGRGPGDWRSAFLNARDEPERTAACRQGAEAGDPAAMNQLGYRLLRGLGCRADAVEAARWGLAAAERGHPEAMYGLGLLHETGRGVARDLGRAAYWYRQAALAGDTMASARLARFPG